MSYDMTPKEARRELRRWFPVAVIATVMLTALGIIVAVLGSKAEFWISTQSAENQAKNAKVNTQTIQNGAGFQEGQISTLQDRIADVASTTISMIGTTGLTYTDYNAERLADGNAACRAASLITTIPPANVAWVAQNCANGALSPTSPLYK
jgi:hypothetical protein